MLKIVLELIERVLKMHHDSRTGFENSAESGKTRPSRNRLEGDRTESDTGYGTITNSGLNRPNSDDSAEIPSRDGIGSDLDRIFQNPYPILNKNNISISISIYYG